MSSEWVGGRDAMRHRRSLVHLVSVVALLLSACGAPTGMEVEPTSGSLVTQPPQGQRGWSVTSTPSPTHTPCPMYTPPPTPELTARVETTAEDVVTPTPLPVASPTLTPRLTQEAAPGPVGQPETQFVWAVLDSEMEAAAVGETNDAREVALERIPDRDPAPPLTIVVDRVVVNRDGDQYTVLGWVRNDGDQVYRGVGVLGTFYDERDYRFGPVKATCACYTLSPGERCAFMLENYARDYVAYHLHPEGVPVSASWVRPVDLSVDSVAASAYGAGMVRIVGTIQNPTTAVVHGVRVYAQLMDSRGCLISVGSRILPGPLEGEQSMGFQMLVPSVPYASVNVSAEGEVR